MAGFFIPCKLPNPYLLKRPTMRNFYSIVSLIVIFHIETAYSLPAIIMHLSVNKPMRAIESRWPMMTC